MAHLYEVHTSDGVYNVSTDQHHDDHDHPTFSDHLIEVIKRSAAQVLGGIILHHYTYKGRR